MTNRTVIAIPGMKIASTAVMRRRDGIQGHGDRSNEDRGMLEEWLRPSRGPGRRVPAASL